MVVCKYFLEGRCKFGDSCRFEHYVQKDYRPQNRQNWNTQNSFPQNQQYQQGNAHYVPQQQNRFSLLNQPQVFAAAPSQQAQRSAPGTVIGVVKEELKQAVQGNQWPFSCFAPFKRPTLPGLLDVSPEELRYEAYKANSTNTSQAYLTRLAELKSDVDQKRNALQNPDNTLMNYLVRYERGEAVFPEGTVLARAAPTSLINHGVASGTPASSFSFKLPQQATAPAPISQFSLGAPAPPPAPAAAPPSFQFKLPPGGPVQQASPAAGVVATPKADFKFGLPQSSAPQQVQPLPGSSAIPRAAGSAVLYSLMEELSSEDLEHFKAAKFSMGKIPIKPPPRELCG